MVLKGRAYTWDVNTKVQHQLGPGLSTTGGFYHNWDGNYRVTDNAAVADAPTTLRTASRLTGASAAPVPHTGTTIDGRPTCRAVTPFGANTQLKVNGSYPLPMEIFVSATPQNLPGTAYLATYAVSTAQVVGSLGRNLSGGARTVNVPLISPQTVYENRRTQLDMRIARSSRRDEPICRRTWTSSTCSMPTRYWK